MNPVNIAIGMIFAGWGILGVIRPDLPQRWFSLNRNGTLEPPRSPTVIRFAHAAFTIAGLLITLKGLTSTAR